MGEGRLSSSEGGATGLFPGSSFLSSAEIVHLFSPLVRRSGRSVPPMLKRLVFVFHCFFTAHPF